jgi:hypothetical protein
MEVDGDGERMQRKEVDGIRFGDGGGDALSGRLQTACADPVTCRTLSLFIDCVVVDIRACCSSRA